LFDYSILPKVDCYSHLLLPLVCLISASIAKGTVGRLALGQIRPWESKVAVPG
jgi:hypothetical protein